MNVCHSVARRKNTFLVSDDVHPQTLAVLYTRARGIGVQVVCCPTDQLGQKLQKIGTSTHTRTQIYTRSHIRTHMHTRCVRYILHTYLHAHPHAHLSMLIILNSAANSLRTCLPLQMCDADDVCGVLVQYPTTDGVVGDFKQLVATAHESGICSFTLCTRKQTVRLVLPHVHTCISLHRLVGLSICQSNQSINLSIHVSFFLFLFLCSLFSFSCLSLFLVYVFPISVDSCRCYGDSSG